MRSCHCSLGFFPTACSAGYISISNLILPSHLKWAGCQLCLLLRLTTITHLCTSPRAVFVTRGSRGHCYIYRNRRSMQPELRAPPSPTTHLISKKEAGPHEKKFKGFQLVQVVEPQLAQSTGQCRSTSTGNSQGLKPAVGVTTTGTVCS